MATRLYRNLKTQQWNAPTGLASRLTPLQPTGIRRFGIRIPFQTGRRCGRSRIPGQCDQSPIAPEKRSPSRPDTENPVLSRRRIATSHQTGSVSSLKPCFESIQRKRPPNEAIGKTDHSLDQRLSKDTNTVAAPSIS